MFTKTSCYTEQVFDVHLAGGGLGICLHMPKSKRKKQGWCREQPTCTRTEFKKEKISRKVLCCISAPGTHLVHLQVKQHFDACNFLGRMTILSGVC